MSRQRDLAHMPPAPDKRPWIRYQRLVSSWRLHVTRHAAGDAIARALRDAIDKGLDRHWRLILRELTADDANGKSGLQRLQEVRLAANWLERNPHRDADAVVRAFKALEGAVGRGQVTMDTKRRRMRTRANATNM
jgi:hypothetical protein